LVTETGRTPNTYTYGTTSWREGGRTAMCIWRTPENAAG